MKRRRSNQRLKAGLLSIVIVGGAVLFGSCNLHKGEKEGTIAQPLNSEQAIEDIIPTTEVPVEESIDFEIEKSVYEMISEKGYELDDFVNFEHEQLEMYSYEQCDNNLAVTTTAVNFRLGPSTDDTIITELKANSTVDPIAVTNNGWYLVQRNGNLGFIRGDYVREVNDKAIVEQLHQLPEIVASIEATTNVNVRPDASTEHTELGTLTAGSRLQMLRILESGWYEVIYNGEIGYVSADYVKEVFTINGPVQKLVAMNEEAIISDAPYGMEIGSAPQYEVARVYAEIDNYYYVECNGQIGFVPKSSCTTLQGTYVVVDISDQMVSLYQDQDVIFTSNVVTGADSTPSDLGIFDIDSKSMNATLTGPGYSVPVTYWMPYNGGEGLHDASWRSSFGGQIYHNSGSHGCINMPDETAQTIYENVSVGDKVIVKR